MAMRVEGTISPIDSEASQMIFSSQQNQEAATKKKPQGLRISPNPASDFFTLQLPEQLTGPYVLQILNAQGQLVSSRQGVAESGVSLSFDLNHYPSGMYWLSILENGAIVTQEKLILTK